MYSFAVGLCACDTVFIILLQCVIRFLNSDEQFPPTSNLKTVTSTCYPVTTNIKAVYAVTTGSDPVTTST
jgi:hypothetical protein